MHKLTLVVLAIALVGVDARAQDKAQTQNKAQIQDKTQTQDKAATPAKAPTAEYQRKSGLWEIKRALTRGKEADQSYQLCVDQASDNALRQLGGGMRSENCVASKVTPDGGKLMVDATCKTNKGSTAMTHAVITGKFDSAYKIESTSKYDPPFRGNTEGSAVIDAKWLSACKPDQKPGDIILANGGRIGTTPASGAAAPGMQKAGPDAAPVGQVKRTRKFGGGAGGAPGDVPPTIPK